MLASCKRTFLGGTVSDQPWIEKFRTNKWFNATLIENEHQPYLAL